MKKLFLIAAVAIALSGCAAVEGLFSPLHKAQTDEQAAVETPEQKALRIAHETIDEANAALTGLNRTIGNNVANAVWTPDDAQDYLDQSKGFGKKLDQIRAVLKLGNIADAKTQADALKAAIIRLQQVAAAHRSALETPEPVYI